MEEVKSRLTALGLSQYEVAVYLTLLRGGTLNASELVKRSGIPHSRVYDITRRLSEKGLIEVVEGKPRRFKPVDPNVALRALVEKEKRRLELTCQRVLSLINAVIVGGYEEKTTWVVEFGFRDIVPPLLRRARHQILLASEPFLIDQLMDDIVWAASRGVNVTLVCYGSVNDMKRSKDLVEAGVELYARKVSSLSIALTDLTAGAISSPTIEYTILTTEPVLARALMDLFYSSLINTSVLVSRPPVLKGRFVSIWAIIHRVRNGDRLRVRGLDLRSGKEVVVEGVVKDKVIDDGIASIVLDTGRGLVRVGGIGARLEDVEGLVFEIVR